MRKSKVKLLLEIQTWLNDIRDVYTENGAQREVSKYVGILRGYKGGNWLPPQESYSYEHKLEGLGWLRSTYDFKYDTDMYKTTRKGKKVLRYMKNFTWSCSGCEGMGVDVVGDVCKKCEGQGYLILK